MDLGEKSEWRRFLPCPEKSGEALLLKQCSGILHFFSSPEQGLENALEKFSSQNSPIQSYKKLWERSQRHSFAVSAFNSSGVSSRLS